MFKLYSPASSSSAAAGFGVDSAMLLLSDIDPVSKNALYLPEPVAPMRGAAHSAHGSTSLRGSIILFRSLSTFFPGNLNSLFSLFSYQSLYTLYDI